MKHKHHIIPRHMGGSDDPDNIMECTVEEHAELHFALYLEHGHWQDYYAAMGLEGIIGKEEIVREQLSRASKKGNTGRKREDLAEYNRTEGKKHHGGGWNKGIPRTEEEKKLMSERRRGHGGLKGRVISEEQKKKQSEAMKGRTPWNKGKPRSEETKRKISESRKRNAINKKNER